MEKVIHITLRGRAHCQRQVAFYKIQVEQARSFFFGGVFMQITLIIDREGEIMHLVAYVHLFVCVRSPGVTQLLCLCL